MEAGRSMGSIGFSLISIRHPGRIRASRSSPAYTLASLTYSTTSASSVQRPEALIASSVDRAILQRSGYTEGNGRFFLVTVLGRTKVNTMDTETAQENGSTSG